ncbi:3-methyl-2-oxobutanoate hydroxymethyltransferase [Corynebacterium pilosum]|uniref:3-methyl-2-oxobutanoate hydroxymethyltransferase n=1 Tax=Corynebacterium pilosum TaxID=35756 RepID=A0A376CLY0_9CORY|nr:3-methyl-2-oxobutanoate hydroxymethyltransferase [Corynebacterium pilosum]STC69119.1 3-methyl-2-oxobutanoate hydroxymethyltransferase [Corynebacterium pilosum]
MTQPIRRLRTGYFAKAKAERRRFSMLTSYDALTARIFDDAGIDILLVGDSAANVVYGMETTLPITLNEMIAMGAAVVRGSRRAFVVVDLPFGTYEAGPEQALANAVRVMQDTGAHAVKLEGGVARAETIRTLVGAGIPVCAHIGYTPQSEHALGGYVVQGRGDSAQAVLADAHAVAEAGAFAVVLEMVPEKVAAQVTKEVGIPTIGIGAGKNTDGQVLVWTDAFGMDPHGKAPRFVRRYASLGEELTRAARAYHDDVIAGDFPGADETFKE